MKILPVRGQLKQNCKISGYSSVTDWKKLRSRDCATAVGDTDFECEEGDEATLFWYKIVKDTKNYQDAETTCKRLGGRLFYRVDGTKTQVQDLHSKLGAAFWTGIWTDDHVTWQGPDGEVIPDSLLAWNSPQEPSIGKSGQTKVAGGGAGLKDLSPLSELMSICDML